MTKLKVSDQYGKSEVFNGSLRIEEATDDTGDTDPEVPMTDTVIFPHDIMEDDLSRDFYLGGKTPWTQECTLTAATGDVTIKFTPMPAGSLTVPFDGDYQYEQHKRCCELVGQGDCAGALDAIRDDFDATSAGVYCEPSVGKPFYIARRPLTEQPTIAGMIYATSRIQNPATDGKRNFVYHVMSENAMGDDGAIRWQINLNMKGGNH